MRLKYQLRGLGIGIILTAALLMIFSDNEKSAAKTEDTVVLAEVETAEAAKEEVMVEEGSAMEQSTLEETVMEEEASVEESVVEEETSVEETTLEEETSVEDTTMEEENTVVETAMGENIEEEETYVAEIITGDVATIKIVSGDDSGTVARKLQTVGLVENASEFDAYLMQHGYDKRIAVGEVTIEKGSTWLEIAEKLAGR